jgi:uncharacterized membrane protein YhdT
MSESLSPKPKLVSTEKKVAEVPDLVAFGVVVIIAWLVTDYMEKELQGVGFIPQQATIARWVGFFVILLVYYGLIRVHVRVKYEV